MEGGGDWFIRIDIVATNFSRDSGMEELIFEYAWKIGLSLTHDKWMEELIIWTRLIIVLKFDTWLTDERVDPE